MIWKMVAGAELASLRDLLERLESVEREFGWIVEELPYGTFPDQSLDAQVEAAIDGIETLRLRVRRRLELEERHSSTRHRWHGRRDRTVHKDPEDPGAA